MSKGITKSCPECKKTLIRHIQPEGECCLEIVCKNCGHIMKAEIKKDFKIKITKVCVIALAIFGIWYYFPTFSTPTIVLQDSLTQ